ncbi:MAG: sialate O-acetylesterase [Dysgonamonadaceae bacterium]|jgi:sialate O-acetylesterase|nr:sialate O-acetylesterase [Dysgonamonadaceae bacterium]
MKTKMLLLIPLLLIFIHQLDAKIVLPAVLGDNMVLQQQSKVKLWGNAARQTKVRVTPSWNKNVYSVNSDDKGDFVIEIQTPEAGGPYQISITDSEEIILKNILIGEVWFCSGQSNMEMPVKGFSGQPVKNSLDAIISADAATPIRMFTTDSENGKWVRQSSKQPQTDCKGRWMEHTSENVANISAVGYFFARYIQKTLHVPVGIIVSSWGGSRVEAWMSREALEPFSAETDLSFLDNEERVKNPSQTPVVLYNGKIAPLTNFAIRGFLWYQGESNRNNADLYTRLMPAFVKDLRTKWNIGDFPFYYVQIAPFNYDSREEASTVRLREVQEQNGRDIPNSGMVTTMDIGDSLLIHPADKETVGNRLAYWALAETYNKSYVGYAPPTYQSMEIKDSSILVSFNHAEQGICPINTKLKGFEIAGNDKMFIPATAIEKGGKVVVSSEKIEKPVAVRYLYKNFAEASVFNVYGIPASPFRTDKW